ncbi:molybdopterin cofactor-binding domain-containing protein [Roseibium salinum]|uniref:Molybdopterin-dependent oxidoreductase n=1 Tax=Roseibium salinum TaxID=1604349 RepID=A0ABT3QVE6_9HYPH|nr:molybdopterin cofactor-binding domain-containing protein [Roseibium sp. DSM 29163]MCX2720898.1 molybdopterin-dependent oxidoreductase [Roseibium sp. DSM 29163]
MTGIGKRFVFDPVARRIGLRVGKVELGQHIFEAYEALAANALGIDPGHLRVLPVSTKDSPDDGLTAGSLSVQVTGAALALEAATVLSNLRNAAAQALGVSAEKVSLDPSTLCFAHGQNACDLFDLLAGLECAQIGTVPDLRAGTDLVGDAVIGARAYLQDMALPGMMHARALRGRAVDDVRPLLPDTCHLIVNQAYAAVLAPDEATLAALWARLVEPAAPGDTRCDGPVSGWIRWGRVLSTRTGSIPDAPSTFSVSASRGFILHGSIAPSCAVAVWDGAEMTVYSHSQGLFALRTQIARVLELGADQVLVHHVPSAGCYGHTGADDAAMDAALIARQAIGQPVRVAWPRIDDIRLAPLGAPMLAEAKVTTNESHTITGWQQEIWSAPHGQRPGGAGHVNLLAAMERDPDLRPVDIPDLPEQVGAGAARNAVPIYAIPKVQVTTHIVQDLPVRTSSLRGLGTHVNTIAIEAAMDRLAARAGETPFACRDRHLDDPRARAVLDKLATTCAPAMAALSTMPEDSIGIGLGRYKNKAAYAAVAARIRLEDAPRLLELWAVVDAGHVVHRDGALNQIEGGMIQSASWTLLERALLRNGQIEVEGWDDYPTLGWDGVPKLHVSLADPGSDVPSLGVGECMVGPTAAAIVNAISQALGQPITDLPLDRDRLIAVLMNDEKIDKKLQNSFS